MGKQYHEQQGARADRDIGVRRQRVADDSINDRKLRERSDLKGDSAFPYRDFLDLLNLTILVDMEDAQPIGRGAFGKS